ncbi:DUF397 domain-containing protein [Streptomyces sp. NPDC037389]|uniref:DUF397 domain-containing protein n=1 Tax=Streptomyces sp. NPDC037389 TaxID=3155369 RepID=UPI0033F5CD6A
MCASEISGLGWRTSTYSGNSGQCVEVSLTDFDEVFIRDSKNPGGSMLAVLPRVWASFVEAVKLKDRKSGH